MLLVFGGGIFGTVTGKGIHPSHWIRNFVQVLNHIIFGKKIHQFFDNKKIRTSELLFIFEVFYLKKKNASNPPGIFFISSPPTNIQVYQLPRRYDGSHRTSLAPIPPPLFGILLRTNFLRRRQRSGELRKRSFRSKSLGQISNS